MLMICQSLGRLDQMFGYITNGNGSDMFWKTLVLLFISCSGGSSETIIQLSNSPICCNTDITESSKEESSRNSILLLVLLPKPDQSERTDTEILQRIRSLMRRFEHIRKLLLPGRRFLPKYVPKACIT